MSLNLTQTYFEEWTKRPLYNGLSKGKIFKYGIEKIIFLCSGFYRKKKPPVRDKSKMHQTQILKQEVSHE